MDFRGPGSPDPDLPKPDWKQPVETEHGLVYALRIRRWVVAKSRKAAEELRTIASAAPGAGAGLEWPKRCLNETRSCFTKELNHDCGNPSRRPRAARFSIGIGTL